MDVWNILSNRCLNKIWTSINTQIKKMIASSIQQTGNPLVSIIIPVFNAVDFIQDTLATVFNQTYPNQEILLIDDGSTDGTVGYVRELFKDKITIIHQENRGPSSARNQGIRAAKGEFIAFLDADDLWHPEKISSQVNILTQHPEIGLLCGNMIDFENKTFDRESHFDKHQINSNFFEDALYVINPFEKLLLKNFISTPTVMVSRFFMNQAGYFNEHFSFAEDFLYWLKFAKICKIAYQSDVMTFRRKHGNNLTNDLQLNIYTQCRLFEQIEKEHSEFLHQQQISLKNHKSSALFNMGYFRLFSEEDPLVSDFFFRSFKYSPSIKSAIFYFATKAGLGSILVKLRKRIRGDFII